MRRHGNLRKNSCICPDAPWRHISLCARGAVPLGREVLGYDEVQVGCTGSTNPTSKAFDWRHTNQPTPPDAAIVAHETLYGRYGGIKRRQLDHRQSFHSGEFTRALKLLGFTHCYNTSICTRMLDWLVVIAVHKATLTARLKNKKDHKRRVKPFKQAVHTLYPRHHEHPVVQLPISVTSSVPEMSASRSPRGLVLLPSLATQDATSAFNVPLRPQEGRKLRNRTETGILGQGTLFRVMPDHGRSLRHTESQSGLDADL